MPLLPQVDAWFYVFFKKINMFFQFVCMRVYVCACVYEWGGIIKFKCIIKEIYKSASFHELKCTLITYGN